MRNAFVLCCSVALLGTVGTASAQDWTKSKWGPNDEIGAANYMTPELVLKAASLIKTGKTYALGIPVDTKTPAYPPRAFKITIVQPGQAGIPASDRARRPTMTTSSRAGSASAASSTASAISASSTSTITATSCRIRRSHRAEEARRREDPADGHPRRAARHGGHYGTDVVKEGTAFNVKEIEEVAKKQGVEIRQGDVVIFHTGWLSLIGKDDKRFIAGEPGLGVEGAKYLTGKGVVAIGADTWGGRGDPVRDPRTSSRCTRSCCR